jgi:hypothetical protein
MRNEEGIAQVKEERVKQQEDRKEERRNIRSVHHRRELLLHRFRLHEHKNDERKKRRGEE